MGLLDNATQNAYYRGNDHGNYQFTSLDQVINQFIVAYVGEDKTISKVKRTDVAFHAQRALQELSFDTFKSTKAQEITLPPSLQMILPQDYVNYTKVSWVDSAGIKHLLYPASKTSNPKAINQNTNGTYYSNLIVNPNFQDDHHPFEHPSHWSFASTWQTNSAISETQIHYSTSSDGVLLTTNGAGTSPYPNLHQRLTLEEGQTYELSYNVVSCDFATVGSTWKIYLNGEGDSDYKPAGTNSVTATGVFTADRFTFRKSLNAGSSDVYIKIQGIYANTIVKTIQLKDFSLVKVDNDGDFGMADSINQAYHNNTTLEQQSDSTTWSSYKSGTPSENQDDYQDDTYWPMDGSRFGLDPQYAQANGSFYIDNQSGKIHFSSNVSGKTVILDYISDSLGTDGEMQVHKFAEEAMYKCIAHAIVATRANTPEQLVRRFKKERFAAIRTAKLRLSNLKLEELTQILRGKSKQIKH